MLDQHLTTEVDLPWESKFQYYVAHHDWDQIKKLLDMIPSEILVDGDLRINISCAHLDSSSDVGKGCQKAVHSSDYSGHDFMIIQNVKILKLPVADTFSSLIKILLEQELAKRLIFLKEYWDSVAEIMPILARACLVYNHTMKTTSDKIISVSSDSEISETDVYVDRDTLEAFHRLVVLYCAQHNMPHLLDLYLDQPDLAQGGGSLCSGQEFTVSFPKLNGFIFFKGRCCLHVHVHIQISVS